MMNYLQSINERYGKIKLVPNSRPKRAAVTSTHGTPPSAGEMEVCDGENGQQCVILNQLTKSIFAISAASCAPPTSVPAAPTQTTVETLVAHSSNNPSPMPTPSTSSLNQNGPSRPSTVQDEENFDQLTNEILNSLLIKDVIENLPKVTSVCSSCIKTLARIIMQVAQVDSKLTTLKASDETAQKQRARLGAQVKSIQTNTDGLQDKVGKIKTLAVSLAAALRNIQTQMKKVSNGLLEFRNHSTVHKWTMDQVTVGQTEVFKHMNQIKCRWDKNIQDIQGFIIIFDFIKGGFEQQHQDWSKLSEILVELKNELGHLEKHSFELNVAEIEMKKCVEAQEQTLQNLDKKVHDVKEAMSKNFHELQGQEDQIEESVNDELSANMGNRFDAQTQTDETSENFMHDTIHEANDGSDVEATSHSSFLGNDGSDTEENEKLSQGTDPSPSFSPLSARFDSHHEAKDNGNGNKTTSEVPCDSTGVPNLPSSDAEIKAAVVVATPSTQRQTTNAMQIVGKDSATESLSRVNEEGSGSQREDKTKHVKPSQNNPKNTRGSNIQAKVKVAKKATSSSTTASRASKRKLDKSDSDDSNSSADCDSEDKWKPYGLPTHNKKKKRGRPALQKGEDGMIKNRVGRPRKVDAKKPVNEVSTTTKPPITRQRSQLVKASTSDDRQLPVSPPQTQYSTRAAALTKTRGANTVAKRNCVKKPDQPAQQKSEKLKIIRPVRRPRTVAAEKPVNKKSTTVKPRMTRQRLHIFQASTSEGNQLSMSRPKTRNSVKVPALANIHAADGVAKKDSE